MALNMAATLSNMNRFPENGNGRGGSNNNRHNGRGLNHPTNGRGPSQPNNGRRPPPTNGRGHPINGRGYHHHNNRNQIQTQAVDNSQREQNVLRAREINSRMYAQPYRRVPPEQEQQQELEEQQQQEEAKDDADLNMEHHDLSMQQVVSDEVDDVTTQALDIVDKIFSTNGIYNGLDAIANGVDEVATAIVPGPSTEDAERQSPPVFVSEDENIVDLKSLPAIFGANPEEADQYFDMNFNKLQEITKSIDRPMLHLEDTHLSYMIGVPAAIDPASLTALLKQRETDYEYVKEHGIEPGMAKCSECDFYFPEEACKASTAFHTCPPKTTSTRESTPPPQPVKPAFNQTVGSTPGSQTNYSQYRTEQPPQIPPRPNYNGTQNWNGVQNSNHARPVLGARANRSTPQYSQQQQSQQQQHQQPHQPQYQQIQPIPLLPIQQTLQSLQYQQQQQLWAPSSLYDGSIGSFGINGIITDPQQAMLNNTPYTQQDIEQMIYSINQMGFNNHPNPYN